MSVRKKYEHWLGDTTGLVTTVLKEDFVSSYDPDEGISDKVVFSGPYQLPTNIQVICLHLFLPEGLSWKKEPSHQVRYNLQDCL